MALFMKAQLKNFVHVLCNIGKKLFSINWESKKAQHEKKDY
ncbi:hypothetical protein PU02_0255 [Bartonella ancashensis]|uniref:Uncharacterized protein n=1 Tax=Bartonella ancashensis TaxID=1318743 RepID=A0A0M4LFM8_9HYPH|nr:hypothetical protein PU02_0255 [Bartonella ancashensis]